MAIIMFILNNDTTTKIEETAYLLRSQRNSTRLAEAINEIEKKIKERKAGQHSGLSKR